MKIFPKIALAVALAFLSLPVAAQISLGVCSSLKSAPKIKDAGYDYLEENVQRLLIPLKSDEEFAENLAQAKASPLPIPVCNGFYPKTILLTGPQRDEKLILDYAETAFRRAQTIGVRMIVLGSGASRRCPEGYDREQMTREFIGLLERMGPIAARYGVTVLLEPLNRTETDFINTVAEGVKIVRKVNHPNVRLVADIYHMLMEKEGPAILTRETEYIAHVHVAEREGRAAPGTHGEDLTPYYRALNKGKYKGGVSIEGRWQDMDKQLVPALLNLRENLTAK